MRSGIAVTIALYLVGAVATAQPLAYTRATGVFAPIPGSDMYGVAHAFDHDNNTSWCAPVHDVGDAETLTMGFKNPQRVSRVRIIAPIGSGHVVQEIRLSDGHHSVSIELSDKGQSEVDLQEPLQGNRYTLTLSRVGGIAPNADNRDEMACLSEVGLFDGDTEVTSPEADAAPLAALLVGAWEAGQLGASTSTLLFAADGTWTWRHHPISGPVKRSLHGTYKIENDCLLMRLGNTGAWMDMGLMHQHIAIDPQDLSAPLNDYDTLKLGRRLAPELAGRYNNARFN